MLASPQAFLQFTVWQYNDKQSKTFGCPVLSESDKDTVKNNLRKLKGKSRWDRVSIVQDLTKIQCAEEKIKYQKLLEEQKQKNEENSENGVWKIVGSRGKKLLIFKYENP